MLARQHSWGGWLLVAGVFQVTIAITIVTITTTAINIIVIINAMRIKAARRFPV